MRRSATICIGDEIDLVTSSTNAHSILATLKTELSRG